METTNYNLKLELLRKALKISQTEFSKELNTKQSYMCEVLSGKRPTSFRLLHFATIVFKLEFGWYMKDVIELSKPPNTDWKYCPQCGHSLK